jgi:hypothetical protein
MPTDLDTSPAASPFADLAGHKYCRLVTFRRNGSAVATPMWFVVADDRVYLKTETPTGKVRRIANDPRVELGPCNFRGRPLGAVAAGRARVLASAEEEARAERALTGRYGIGRRLFGHLVEPILRRRGLRAVYLEVAPTGGRQ